MKTEMAKSSKELWGMIAEFEQLARVEPTPDGQARQLSIAEHMTEWLQQHPGAAQSIEDYHLGQGAGLCVAMAPSRQDVRSRRQR